MTEVNQLAKILTEHGLTRLKYEKDGVKIVLERAALSSPAAQPAQVAQTSPAAAAPALQSGTVVTSPLVGVAYRAREPGAAALVEVGQVVKKGDAVCIIEAMKMFSEIPAPCDGTVREILYSDGELVEFGAVLLVIE